MVGSVEALGPRSMPVTSVLPRLLAPTPPPSSHGIQGPRTLPERMDGAAEAAPGSRRLAAVDGRIVEFPAAASGKDP